MSRWLDTCKRKQHPGVAASSPLAPDEVGLPFLSRFGSLFRTLIERCEYVSLNVLQNLLSAKLALHVTAVLATTRKMNRLPRVYIVLLRNGANRCNRSGGLSAATILTLIDSERQRLCVGALNGSYEAPQFNAPAVPTSSSVMSRRKADIEGSRRPGRSTMRGEPSRKVRNGRHRGT